jgi:hypothetical protein
MKRKDKAFLLSVYFGGIFGYCCIWMFEAPVAGVVAALGSLVIGFILQERIK